MLDNVVEEMAIAGGVPKPAVYIIPDSDPNAFATGPGPEKSSIAVTAGLLDALNREELQGVVSHEMSHVSNYDVRLMTVVAALVGSVLLLSDWGRRGLWWGGGRRRSSNNGGGGARPGARLLRRLDRLPDPRAAHRAARRDLRLAGTRVPGRRVGRRADAQSLCRSPRHSRRSRRPPRRRVDQAGRRASVYRGPPRPRVERQGRRLGEPLLDAPSDRQTDRSVEGDGLPESVRFGRSTF